MDEYVRDLTGLWLLGSLLAWLLSASLFSFCYPLICVLISNLNSSPPYHPKSHPKLNGQKNKTNPLRHFTPHLCLLSCFYQLSSIWMLVLLSLCAFPCWHLLLHPQNNSLKRNRDGRSGQTTCSDRNLLLKLKDVSYQWVAGLPASWSEVEHKLIKVHRRKMKRRLNEVATVGVSFRKRCCCFCQKASCAQSTNFSSPPSSESPTSIFKASVSTTRHQMWLQAFFTLVVFSVV